MRLTIEEDRETIKRYGHVRPARGLGVHSCSAKCPGGSRACTLERGHRGPHVAHGMFRRVVAVWDERTAVQRSPENVKRSAKTMGPRAIHRAERPSGVLEALGRGIARLTDSIEEIALILFFLGMTGFVIEWVIMIVRSR